MGLEVSRALTVNESGEPVRTFRGGERIVFHLHFRATDIPAQTRIRTTFHIKFMQNVGVGAGDDLQVVFIPVHYWQFEATIGPGHWVSWTTWTIPDMNPFPSPMPLREWERLIIHEHWRTRSWGGLWELTGLVSPTEPPREGQFDHNRERWLYSIRY